MVLEMRVEGGDKLEIGVLDISVTSPYCAVQ